MTAPRPGPAQPLDPVGEAAPRRPVLALVGERADDAAGPDPEAAVVAEGRPGPLGDDELFRALYPALRRFAAVVRPPEVDPDDLVQEAVYRVLRRRSLGSLDDPAGYLRRAVVNLASNERRRLGRQRRALRRAAPDEEAPDAYGSDLAELQRLSAADRALVFLVDVERWGFTEAAAVVGCSPEAARARASRARRDIRRALEREP